MKLPVLAALLAALSTASCRSAFLACKSDDDCASCATCANGSCVAKPSCSAAPRDAGRDMEPDWGADLHPEAAPEPDARDSAEEVAADVALDKTEDRLASDAMETGPSNMADTAAQVYDSQIDQENIDGGRSLALLSAIRSAGGTPVRVVKQGSMIALGEWDLDGQADDGRGSMQLYDVSDPSAPAKLGQFDTADQEVQDVAVVGNRVYLANDLLRFRIVDISDPKRPALLQDTGVGGTYAHSITMLNRADTGLAALVGYHGSGELFIYGLNGASTVTTFLPPDTSPRSDYRRNLEAVVARDNRAYILASDGEAQIRLDALDITQLDKEPVVLGSLRLSAASYGWAPSNLVLSGDLLYWPASDYYYNSTFSGPGGLRIISVADPGQPKLVGRYDLAKKIGAGISWKGTGIAVQGNTAFVVGQSVVYLFDVSNPAAPSLVNSVPTPSEFGACQGGTVTAEGDLVYVGVYCLRTNGWGGLAIYRWR
jgi:hypothetical protein